MGQQVVEISVESSVIEVSGSLYPVDKISGVKKVKVKQTMWEFLWSGGQRHAILVKMQGETYFLLVVSREENKIDEVISKIKMAISSQMKGNFSYQQSITLNGDLTNQSGNFGVGFNKGEVDLGQE